MVENLPAMKETWVWFLGWEDPLEKKMSTHSNILAWEIPCILVDPMYPGGSHVSWWATAHGKQSDMTLWLNNNCSRHSRGSTSQSEGQSPYNTRPTHPSLTQLPVPSLWFLLPNTPWPFAVPLAFRPQGFGSCFPSIYCSVLSSPRYMLV